MIEKDFVYVINDNIQRIIRIISQQWIESFQVKVLCQSPNNTYS
jgi:hypothetical protein